MKLGTGTPTSDRLPEPDKPVLARNHDGYVVAEYSEKLGWMLNDDALDEMQFTLIPTVIEWWPLENETP